MTDAAETQEISDLEIEMHIFRLIRGGKYRTAKAVFAAATEDLPTVCVNRIRRCTSTLAGRILKNDA